MKNYQKRFPADTAIDANNLTFLTDKKVDAELYALLLIYSYGEEGKTYVNKKDIPSYAKIAERLEYKSRQTANTHFKYLVEKEYIKDEGDRYQILTNKETMFFTTDTNTLYCLIDFVKRPVLKTYIFLGQRWAWKGSEYVFTKDDIAKHIGMNVKNNTDAYQKITTYLEGLKKMGLIDYVAFRDGKTFRMRLTNHTVYIPLEK